ncbi:type IA DNA topoisomerase [Pseudoflavonifractor sp. 524-17]|uniref:DNA topoisomerase n=1 Tax=Pseudoflavonifractor sp. 524-17 TaxID=2304577 RepID=UPI001DC8E0F3|nr:type IA DNA topoisomerase [Pseudoflavonifractor sp. 524-17]
MQLVIAEKPSVAQAIAGVLGAGRRRGGYWEGGGWLVSWCVGHLVELAPADAYDPRYSRWSCGDLPIVPDRWRYQILPDTKGRFDTLAALMAEEQVDTVICATDAGREGELIFRLVYRLCGCTKPVKRLWISSMEESAIRKGFDHLADSRAYDSLYAAALCRAQADWLVGINATRLFTCLYKGRTLNVGRVLTPTLTLLVEREAAIQKFKKEKFYTVELDTPALRAASGRFSSKTDAERLRTACLGTSIVVKSVEQRDRTEHPPALYDLTALQREANRLFGYTAQETLDYLQALYEKRLATYPRTDSRYLTEDMADGLPGLCVAAAGAMPFLAGRPFPVHAAQVVDGGKVTDHHAILPTAELAGTDLAALPTGERNILSLIAARLLCAVGEPHIYAETAVILECGGVSFTAKGRTVKAEGWREIETAFRSALKQKTEPSAPTLPALAEGQRLEGADALLRAGATSPPVRYTEDTLLAAMETAGAEEAPDDAGNGAPAQAQRSGLRGEKEGQRSGADARRQAGAAECSLPRRGLGTPATRAATIEKLVRSGFVERRGRQLIPTERGIALVWAMPDQLKSAKLTAQWEEKLGAVERGELAPEDFMAGITAMLTGLVEAYRNAAVSSDALAQSGRTAVGKCPRCGKNVVEGKKSFYCESYYDSAPCGFALWKNHRFFTAKRKELTPEIAASLLKTGRAAVTGLFSEQKGVFYDATVVLSDDGGKYVRFKLEFDKKPNQNGGDRT